MNGRLITRVEIGGETTIVEAQPHIGYIVQGLDGVKGEIISSDLSAGICTIRIEGTDDERRIDLWREVWELVLPEELKAIGNALLGITSGSMPREEFIQMLRDGGDEPIVFTDERYGNRTYRTWRFYRSWESNTADL